MGADNSCIMIRYFYADDDAQLAVNNTSRCQLLMAADGTSPNSDASRAVIGFKAYTQGVVLDFALYTIPGGLIVGEIINNELSVSSVGECLQACTSHGEECVAVKITGDALNNAAGDSQLAATIPAMSAISSMGTNTYSCVLLKDFADPEWMTSYRISGDALTVTAHTNKP
jgi:hypothetical protein